MSVNVTYILFFVFCVDAAGLSFFTILFFSHLDHGDQLPPKQSRNVKHITSCWSFPKRSELSGWITTYICDLPTCMCECMYNEHYNDQQSVRVNERERDREREMRRVEKWKNEDLWKTNAWLHGWMGGWQVALAAFQQPRLASLSRVCGNLWTLPLRAINRKPKTLDYWPFSCSPQPAADQAIQPPLTHPHTQAHACTTAGYELVMHR